jgi:hypothetical protein
MTIPIDQLRSGGGQILSLREEGLFAGWLPIEPPAELALADTNLRWLGVPLSAFWWNRVKAFFAWTYSTYGGESQLRMFYNSAEKKWCLWALPQEISQGLSTRELEHDPQRTKILSEIQRFGYGPIGTIHHHCGISAFQSGTDRNDEKHQFGIHITLGNLNSPTWSSHWRITYRGVEYTQTQGLEALVEQPDLTKPTDQEVQDNCPANWKKMMKEAPRYTTTYFPQFHNTYTPPGGRYLGARGYTTENGFYNLHSDDDGYTFAQPRSVTGDAPRQYSKKELKRLKKAGGYSGLEKDDRPGEYWEAIATGTLAIERAIQAHADHIKTTFPDYGKKSIEQDLILFL